MLDHADSGCDGDDTPALHRELIRSGVGVSAVRGEPDLDPGVIRDEYHLRDPRAD